MLTSVLVALITISVLVYGQDNSIFKGCISFPGQPCPRAPDDSSRVDKPEESKEGMQVLYSWKQVDFTFRSKSDRRRMICNNTFIPVNNLILDVDVYGEGPDLKVFVTLPRVRPGVPATLATVSAIRHNGEILLSPFPDWISNNQGDCENGITSVFRTQVDSCGRLWVLDSGNNNVFNGNGRIVCNPKVLIYDLQDSNKLVGKYQIPMSMIENHTLLVTIAVDIRDSDCSNAFAYIADSMAYKMIVFNLRTEEFWRINSIYFYPYPDHCRFNVNSVSFDLMGGVFGLTLGPVVEGNRRLYFHSIVGVKQSWVDTAELRNRSLWSSNMNAKPKAFKLLSGTRPSQSAAATMGENGVMYFGLIGSNEMACWYTQLDFDQCNIAILAKDDKNLQFNSGIKVYGDKLYALTSRLQNYVTKKVNTEEINYRVLVGDVSKLTTGTSCQVDTSNRMDFGPEFSAVENEHAEDENIEVFFAQN